MTQQNKKRIIASFFLVILRKLNIALYRRSECMRTFWRWTVIFRGHFIRNIINMFKRIGIICLWVIRVSWHVLRIPIVVACWILGINWFDVQAKHWKKSKNLFYVGSCFS